MDVVWPAGVVPGPDGTIPSAVLQLPLATWPSVVNPRHRETHLSDDDFRRVLGLSRAAFYAMPCWRQQRIKQAARLF